GHSRTVVLDRPKALNALNLEMCIHMKQLLTKWCAPDSGVGLLMMKGAGEKAFCAGGDVKTVWQKIHDKKDIKEVTEFFKVEYQMNNMLAVSPVPQISFWNGIVMGGGVGISRLGEFRIATEKTMFAMPESGIGLFPDVGSSSWLSHMPDGLGEYIGLTGVRLKGADTVVSGIATHFVPSWNQPSTSTEHTLGIIPPQLQSYSTGDRISNVYIISGIRKCFADKPSVIHILQALEQKAAQGGEPGEWAQKTLQVWCMSSACPTSLVITLGMLHHGKRLSSVAECLQMEYRMVTRCMEAGNFYEGVRALLVDKDNAPVWDPKTLEEVLPHSTDNYFSRFPKSDDELRFD
ncbi:unnamed protein product, partial [Ectocarpus fasciculatus]